MSVRLLWLQRGNGAASVSCNINLNDVAHWQFYKKSLLFRSKNNVSVDQQIVHTRAVFCKRWRCVVITNTNLLDYLMERNICLIGVVENIRLVMVTTLLTRLFVNISGNDSTQRNYNNNYKQVTTCSASMSFNRPKCSNI